MFESDDFDFDENFLRNVDATETQYYSQQLESNENICSTKKPRLEIENVKTLNSKICNVNEEPEDSTNNAGEVLKRNHSAASNSHARNDAQSSTCRRSSSTVIDTFQNCNDSSKENSTGRANVNLSRKNLIFEILKKGPIKSSNVDNSKNAREKFQDSSFLRASSDQSNVPNDDGSTDIKCKLQKSKSQSFNERPKCYSESLTMNKSSSFTDNLANDVKRNSFLNVDTNLNRKNVILKEFRTSGTSNLSKVPIVKECSTIIDSEKNILSHGSNSVRKNDNSLCDSRRTLILNTFNKTVSDNKEHTQQMSKRNSTAVVLSEQAVTGKKLTLVRKFPGPAGLLPDTTNLNIPPITFLNCLDENDNDGVKDSDESNVSKYCSQDTRNLFSKGAWQLMLDDLAPNFLNGHEISAIKQRAQVDYYRNDKIPFLAGIVQHIEYGFENPYVLLKDFTDVIEGTIHRDVPVKYPNILEPGVVMLLMNVGLLVTGTLRKKYHVMIAPQNIVNIYLDKTRIVDKLHVESTLKNVSSKDRCNLLRFENRSNVDVIPNNNKSQINDKDHKLLKSISYESNVDLDSEVSKCMPKQPFKSLFESSGFDSKDDVTFACLNVDEIANSQNQKLFCSDSKISNDLAQSLNEKVMNFQTKKHFESEATTSKSNENFNTIVEAESQSTNLIETLTTDILEGKLLKESVESRNEFNSMSKTVDNFELSSTTLENDKSKFNSSSKTDARYTEESIKNCNYDKKNVRFEESQFATASKASIRKKLLQFRSKDVLTPPETKEPNTFLTSTRTASESVFARELEAPIIDNVEATKINISENLLRGSGNDSDDEILSQLDVDSIVSRYNK